MEKKDGKRSVSNSMNRNTEMKRTSDEMATRRVPSVSEETKRYKFSEDELSKKQKSKNSKSKNSKKKGKKKSKVFGVIKKILIALLILGILAGLIFAGIIAGIFFGFFGDDFKMTKEDLVISFSNSEVYDSEGNLICTLNGNEQRKIISLDQMPEYLPKAYVAIEDERFYEHNGVDIKRTGAATITYLLNRGSSSFGGSTITQQLVKNITNEDEDSALRKVKEMARAIQIEKEISKDNILELYLNIIFIGGNNINGVALGAEYYFNKDVSELDLAECAFLAGINHTPNSYNPFNGTEEQIAKNIENGKDRTKTVLKKMLELGYTNQEDYDAAIAKVDAGLAFSQGALSSDVVYSSHTEAAINQIVEQLMDEKGMTKEMAETVVYGGGYKIYTTQVTSIQNTMEEEMSKDKYIISSKTGQQSQAAMVMIDHTTGYVVGCVGQLGTKTTNGNLNRAIQTERQIGSAMKPIAVIAPAVQEGLISPASVYEDKQTNEFTGDNWPKNYYNSFYGKQTVREAIKISGNVIPVRILKELGVSKSVSYLEKMGLDVPERSQALSLALGAAEFTPLEMAAAYATIANDGTYIEPTFYTKVVDSSGNVVVEPHQTTTEVLGKSEAYIVKSILTEPVLGVGTTATGGRGGTATYCKISGIDVCAKTGTTDDDYDRWLCGFTPYYTAACWFGYDINEEIVYNYTPTNPAGGIWSGVMKTVHSELESKTFVQPDNIIKVTVCHDSGLLPSAGCTNTVTDIFIKGKEPTQYCNTRSTTTTYSICADSGLLAVDGACTNIVTKTYSADEVPPTEYCNIHKVHEVEESPSPSVSSSPTASASTSAKPSTSPSPSTTTKPTSSSSPSSSTSASPSTTPSPSTNAVPVN